MDSKPTVLVDSAPPTGSMVERMDSAIGETSSLVGAVLSEVVRRALRGGIGQLGERLNEHASGAVSTAIAEQLPALERTVIQTAGLSARTAALDAVEDRVVKAELQTAEARRQLAERIAEAERTAEARAEEARQALAQRIAAAERASLAQTEEARELLTERIERAQSQTLAARRELAQQIERAEKKAEEYAASTAQELRTEIETTTRRAGQEVSAALTKQMDELCERSRKGTAMLKTRVKALEDLAGGLKAKLAAEEKARQQAEERHQELARLAEALLVRIDRLEQPGFLGRLWNRLFGRKK